MKIKGLKKDLLIVAVIILLVVLLSKGVNIQTVEEYYLTHIDDIKKDSKIVTISIRCDTILDNKKNLNKSLLGSKYIPKDGVILDKTTMVLRQNDTVFDVIKRITKYKKIHLDFLGADKSVYNSVYIKGINHIYEFSCGPLSGWMYKVNGKFPNYGVSRYSLKDKDVIEFVYTCNLGDDVGGSFKEKKE